MDIHWGGSVQNGPIDPFPERLFQNRADVKFDGVIGNRAWDSRWRKTRPAMYDQRNADTLADTFQVIHPVTVEFVGKVPGFDSLTQLVIRLPDGLPSNSDVLVSITLHGQTSNKVRIHVQ